MDPACRRRGRAPATACRSSNNSLLFAAEEVLLSRLGLCLELLLALHQLLLVRRLACRRRVEETEDGVLRHLRGRARWDRRRGRGSLEHPRWRRGGQWASLSRWEWRAAQSRWAHPRKAPEPRSGSAKGALWPCCAASPTDLPSSLMPLTPLRSGGLTWRAYTRANAPLCIHVAPLRAIHVTRTACDHLGPTYLLTCLLANLLTCGAACGDGGGGGGGGGVGWGKRRRQRRRGDGPIMLTSCRVLTTNLLTCSRTTHFTRLP